ncbi:hypothetical protein [Acinetobacter beijerinckii]|uniref:Uncharacterized protein n=1 Tax=Acinetobacter beijerinckii CIP 110307 TaxID=1217648 RepID=N9F6M5_9GAMM|nr:hypothetical protein [Acinetobacter beijerinckii]ENW02965.1 hypothetical protein F933_03371 [Acinetobacter beijerinckii CIP 110307]
MLYSNKLLTKLSFVALATTLSLGLVTSAQAAKKGTACTSVSSQMSNIYEVKFLCPDLGSERLTIAEIYNKGYRVASLAFQGNIAALIVEQQ